MPESDLPERQAPKAPPPRLRARQGSRVLRAMGYGALGLCALVCVLAVGARAYLTPARLTQLVQRTLDAQLVGPVHIGEVTWSLPCSLNVRDVVAGGDAGAPELRVAQLSARLQLLGLLRRRIVVGPVHIERPMIRLHPVDAAHPDTDALAAVFAARHPAAPDPNAAPFDWPIVVSDIKLTQATLSLTRPDQHLSLEQLSIDASRVRVDLGEPTVRVSLDAGVHVAHAALRPSPGQADATLALGPTRLGFEALTVTVGQQHIDVSAHNVSAHAAGASLVWSGRAHLAETLEHSRTDSRLAVDIDTQAPVWPQLVGAQTWAALAPRGTIAATLETHSDAQNQRAQATLAGTQAEFKGIGLNAISTAVRWQAGTLVLDALSVSMPEGDIHLTGEAHIDATQKHVGVHTLRLSAQALMVQAALRKLALDAAVFAPNRLDGQLDLAGESLWPAVSTQMTLGADGVWNDAQRPAFLPPTLHLKGQAKLTPDAVRLDSATVLADGATLMASGQVGLKSDAPITAHVTIDAPEPKQTLRRFSPKLNADHIALTLDVAGTAQRPEGTLDLHIAALRQGTDRRGALDVALPVRLADGVLRCRNGSVSGPAAQLNFVGQASLQTPQGNWRTTPDLDVELRLARAELATLLPDAAVKGDARLNLHVSGAANRPHMAGVLRVVGLEAGTLVFRDAHMQLSGDGTHLGVRQLVLSPKQGGHIYAHAWLSPQTGGIDAQVSAHDVPAAWLGLKTPTPAAVQLTAGVTGSMQALDATLEAEAGRVFALSADAHVQPTQQALRLDVRGRGALDSLAEWLEGTGPLKGEVGLLVHADGDWHQPTLHMQVRGDALHWGSQALGNEKMRFVAETRSPGDYRVTLDMMDLAQLDAQVRTTRGLIVDANARFDALRAGSLVAGLSEHGTDATVTGLARVHYVAPPGGAAFELSAALDIAHLEARAAGRTIALKKPWQLSMTNAKLSVSQLKLGGTAGDLEAQAQLTGPWLDSDPDARAHSILEGMAQGTLDLNFVAALIPAMGHAQGEMAWAGHVSGSLAEPQGDGSLRIDKEWVLRPRGTLIEVHMAKGEVRINKQRLSLHGIEGSLEAGTFALGGHVDLAGLRPKAYQIHLSANDLPLHTPDLVLEANVVADATGEGLLPLIKGRIDVTRGRFLKKLEFKDLNFVSREPDTSEPLSQSAPWLRELRLDLLATSSNGVDIRLDAGAFAVEATLQTDLHITGNALVPHIVGRINAERGSLHFPKADLQLTQAQLDFEPTPKNPLGAALNVQADGEITPSGGGGTGTQTYSVALRVDGPLKELQFDLSSDQGLGKLEILSLLTTGHASLADLTSGSSDDGAQLDAALAFAGSQVSGPLTQLAERQLERALNLRLELNAEVTQENVRLTAAKNLNRRLRLEGAYTHGISAEQSIVSTRAQLSLTDKLLLEGTAARDLSGTATSGSTGSIQSNVELKYRLVGH